MKTPSYSSFILACLLSAVVSLLFPPSLEAQTTAARPDRGIMPGASYSVSDIENINLSNGNVQLTIPLASLPPIAGGKLNLTLTATYNSKLWNVTRTENQMDPFFGCPTWVVDTPQESDLGGWVINAGYRIVFREANEDFDYVVPNPPPTQDCETNQIEQAELQHQFYRTILIGPDGAEHELRPIDNYPTYGGFRPYLGNYYKDKPDTTGAPMRYYSFDGSYIWATINPSSHSTRWTVTLKDGTRVVQYSNGIQRITDANGNSIKIFSDANGTHYQDEQTGREIRFGADNKVWYQKPGGAWDNVTIVWGTTTVQGKLYRVNNWVPTGGETGGGSYCWHDQVLQSTLPVIREIIFPQTQPGQPAQRYSFSYNSDETTTASNQVAWSCGGPGESYNRTVSKGLGSLSQITTPTGAIVKYSYSKDSKHSFSLFGDTDDIARETLTQKQVIHDGVTDTWTYNIIEFNACGGTVTAPDGSVTTETCYSKDAANAQFFGNVPGKAGLTYRSNRSNVELVERHWTTTLVFTGANQLSTGSFANVTFNPLVDAEYTTLLDNTPSHNPVKMSAKTFQYDYNGNLTQTKEYDWFDPALVSRDAQGVPTGVPASATLLRTTNHSYYNGASSSSSANVYATQQLPPALRSY